MHDVQYSDVVTFTLSMGELAWIKRHRPLVHSGVIMTAGIGVGEISSLVAAGAITLSQALKLVSELIVNSVWKTNFICEQLCD